MNDAIARGYSTAFEKAQQQQQFGANLGLQGQQAAMQGAGLGITGQNAAMQGAQTGISGQQAAMQGAQTGLSGLGQAVSGYNLGLQGAQTGLQGVGQGISGEQAAMQGAGLGMQGAGMGLQGIGTTLQGFGQGQQGLSTALQGYGQAGQAAGQLGQLGSQQLAAEQGVLGTQQQYGAMQQQAEQQKINQAIQNYAMQEQAPMQSLAQMSGLLRGLPLEARTTQSYQAAPSALQSLAGIGTGIAGVASMTKAKGGTVKSYAKGGIVDYADGGVTSQRNAESIAQDMVPQQLEKVQPRTLPDYIRIPLLNQKIQEQQAADAAMAAQQSQANQESLKQMVLAQANDLGITRAQSNLPDGARMAGGGIVSFVKGGLNAPEFPFTPTDLDYSYLEEAAKRLNNPATGMPYTFEEKAAENRARESKLGIKDLTEDQLTALKKKEDKLADRESRAKGLGLLAASNAIMSARGPGLGFIGSGLGAYGKTAGAELEKVDALRENYAQQGDLIRARQMDMKRAQLTGDDAAYKLAERDVREMQIKQGEAANTNITRADAAKQKGLELQYEYEKDMKKAQISAAAAHNTDLRWLTNVKYKELVAAGAPANENTMSKASSLAANEMGKIAGSDKLDLDTSKLSADIAGKIESSIAASPEIKRLADLKTVEQIKPSGGNATKLAEYERQINAEKKRISTNLLSGLNADGTSPTAPPAPASAPAPGGNKRADKVQSANKYVLDGFVFPDQKSLDAYKKAKTNP
jgi:hypothetical protein